LNGERHVRFSREREVDRESDVREMVILRLERRFSLSLSDRGRRSKRGVGVFFGKRRISSPTSPSYFLLSSRAKVVYVYMCHLMTGTDDNAVNKCEKE
jgi:hypothetical protein